MTKHVAYNAILAWGCVRDPRGWHRPLGRVDRRPVRRGRRHCSSTRAGGPPLRHRPLPAGLARRGRSPSAAGLLVGAVNGFSSPDSASRPSSRRWACSTSRAAPAAEIEGTRSHGSPGARNLATRASVAGCGGHPGHPTGDLDHAPVRHRGGFVPKKTPFGRAVYAAGGNERAAALSGVPVRNARICSST